MLFPILCGLVVFITGRLMLSCLALCPRVFLFVCFFFFVFFFFFVCVCVCVFVCCSFLFLFFFVVVFFSPVQNYHLAW